MSTLSRYQYGAGKYQMRDGDVAVYYVLRSGSRWRVSRDPAGERPLGGPPFATLKGATAWCERLYATQDEDRVKELRAQGVAARGIVRALRA